MTPTDSRVFLGLKQPPLQSAAQWFFETFRSELGVDLSNLIVVLPTRRARQRLLQLLTQQAKTENCLLSLPTIITIGQLPEQLYTAEKQLANELAQQIAWSQALRETPRSEIECLTGRHDLEQLHDWQPLAMLISKLHLRLANDIWSFSSVAREVKKLKGFLKQESARWDALAAIQKRYYTILQNVGLWDKQAARNFAAAGLEKAGEIRCSSERQIVLVGTADLNRSVTEMLRQIVATNRDQVRALVVAPEEMANRFNEFGSLISEKWLDSKIPIHDRQILIVDQPADQTDAVAQYITHLDGDFTSDEITIGVPDETLIPHLQRSLNANDIKHRNLIGHRLSQTSPVSLMVACRDYLETQDYNAFASLVRHPDLFDWLCEKVDNNRWLSDLDVFQNNSLPGKIAIEDPFPFGQPDVIEKSFFPGDADGERAARREAESARQLNLVHASIQELLQPLLGASMPIAHWAKPWTEVLLRVYGARGLDKTDPLDSQTIRACEVIYEAFGNQQQVSEKLDATATASQALDWAIQATAEHRFLDPVEPTAIELAGWLDLSLDDAPVMAITNVNDQHVPSSEVGHPFLPNELCKELQILDNDRRYARDVYAMIVIQAVREHLLLIVGRRDESGEALKPSRLLFCDDPDVAARRAKAFFSFDDQTNDSVGTSEDQHSPATTQQAFPIPNPVCSNPPKNLSVTKFRDYIKCPYRFYLKHILKLESLNDDWRELSGGTFGDLAHNVLEAFGKSDLRDATDCKQIFEFLNDQLTAQAKQNFPGSRQPAVQIQIEQLRLRLEKFAAQQSRHRKSGWRIVSTEEHLFHEFDVDGQPFLINGKIDRVDQHEHTGQIAVWDYKSSDKGDPPGKVHYASKKQEWKDLQLPLYRHLVKEVGAVAGADFNNVVMGYILLPRKLEDVGFFPATWSADELASADERAREIIRHVRESRYWPPNPQPPMFSEEFAAICQDNVFEPFVVDQEEALEAAPW